MTTEPLPRVAFVTGSVGGGHGWERLATESIRSLARLGHPYQVLVREDADVPGGIVDHVERVLPRWPQGAVEWPLAVARRLPRALGALAPVDVVHCLMEPYVPVASLVSLALRRPLVVTAVGTYSVQTLSPSVPWSPFQFWSRRAARVVCISSYTEKRVREKSPRAKTVVVNPGVDAARFCPGEPSGPAASASGRVLLSAGAVKPRKGHDVVVEALARLGPELADTSFYAVGDLGTHQAFVQALREKASALGVGDRVHFLGEIPEDELIGWYRRSDATVLCASNRGGHFEGFGLVLLEANACGTPVVACRESGAEDIVIDGENGFLVPQEDPDATAEALRRLLGDRDRARQMGARGIEHAAAMSWERSARGLSAVYADALGASGRELRVAELREEAGERPRS